jgi:hypothetical protein
VRYRTAVIASLILDAEDTGRIRVSSTVSCVCVLRVIISGFIS